MSRTWTPEQFWDFVGGLAGEFERDQMRDALAERGLQIVARPHASWIWYGRYEGAIGGFIPPQVPGVWPQISYRVGNLIGRHFGPPHPRT